MDHLRDAVVAAARELQAGRAPAVLSAELGAWQQGAASIARAARWVDDVVSIAPTVGPPSDWAASLEMVLDDVAGPDAAPGATAPRRRGGVRDAASRVAAAESLGRAARDGGHASAASAGRAGSVPDSSESTSRPARQAAGSTPGRRRRPPGGALVAGAAARIAERLGVAEAHAAPARTDVSPPRTAGSAQDATAGEANAPSGIDLQSGGEAALPAARPHAVAGTTPPASLLSALGREWGLPLDGPRASADVLARLSTPSTWGDATSVVPPPGRDRAASSPGGPAGRRAASKTPEGPDDRAGRERPVVSASTAVETGGTVVPTELMVRDGRAVAAGVPRTTTSTGRVETDATRRPPDGPPIPMGTGADPFYDLDELAERVGAILQEEARRSGIDV